MEEITEDNIRDILQQPEYLLFYFTASWCKPCQRVYPDIIKIIKPILANNKCSALI